MKAVEVEPATAPEEHVGARWLRRMLNVVAVAGVAYLVWVVWDRDLLAAWIRDARPLPFFVALAVLPALGVPLTPFFVIAGATFGIRLGLIGTLLALAFNLTLCYWIARSSVRPRLEALFRRFDYQLPDFGRDDRSALRFTLLVKLAPGVPGFVKNYGLGAAGVPFPLYLGLSMLITGAYATAFVVLGESIFDHDLRQATIAVVAIAALALGLWWWARRPVRRPADATGRAAAPPADRAG